MIIDENQLSCAHNISNTTTFETTTKQPPHNNRPKRLLLKASSYLSIGQYIAKHHVHDLMTLGDVKVNLEDVKCIYESNYKLLFEKYM